ncbi:MAG: hypothetical protein ACK46X_02150 [Candidatus Sericytochromatia bacterium]
MLQPIFLLAIMLNMGAVVLTVRFVQRLTSRRLNQAGQARTAGMPQDALALINSGEPAFRLIVILFRREYRGFGDRAVTRAGDLAFAAQLVALPVMLLAFVTPGS